MVASAIGGVLAAQAPLNSTLARTVGGVQASVVALGISSPRWRRCARTTAASGPARLGDATLDVAVGGGLMAPLRWQHRLDRARARRGRPDRRHVAGQLALAVEIDHFGWLGVDRSPITASKVFGIVLLALGTWLVVGD